MAIITSANTGPAYAFPGGRTLVKLNIKNDASKAVSGIRILFKVLGNDLGTDAGTVECGYAAGSSSVFADVSIAAGKSAEISGYIEPPASLETYFASTVRIVPVYVSCTVRYKDGSLWAGLDSVIENIHALNHRYNPQILSFMLERAEKGIPNDEGEDVLTTLKLGLEEPVKTSFMRLTLYYAENAMPETDSASIDLTARIPDLLSGVTDSTDLIFNSFSNESNWNFLLIFGDAYESTGIRLDIPRAFANLHLSGSPEGGACFGGFCSQETGTPKLESWFECEFHKGIRGVNIYSTEEVATGGRWIDGKPIYKKTVVIPSVSSGATATNIVSLGTGGIDTLVHFQGILTRNDGNLVYPLGFDTVSTTVYKADFYLNKSNDGLTVRTNSSTAITGGHVTIYYTKSTDAATTEVT